MANHVLTYRSDFMHTLNEPAIKGGKKLQYEISENGCWEVTSHYMHNNGYVMVRRNGTHQFAHRYVYELFKGKIPDGYVICHQCDNRKCINPDHLVADTQSRNMRDAYERGRRSPKYGSTHTNAVLTEEIVIGVFYAEGKSGEIAKRFGINYRRVSQIKQRKIWKHITDRL